WSACLVGCKRSLGVTSERRPLGAWLGWPEPSRDMESPKRDRGKPSLTKENIAPAELETTEIAAVAVQGRASGPSNGAEPRHHTISFTCRHRYAVRRYRCIGRSQSCSANPPL